MLAYEYVVWCSASQCPVRVHTHIFPSHWSRIIVTCDFLFRIHYLDIAFNLFEYLCIVNKQCDSVRDEVFSFTSFIHMKCCIVASTRIQPHSHTHTFHISYAEQTYWFQFNKLNFINGTECRRSDTNTERRQPTHSYVQRKRERARTLNTDTARERRRVRARNSKMWNRKNPNVDICIPITNINYTVAFAEPTMINIDIRNFRFGI